MVVFQPSQIRNASGNGGGVLIGYMTAVVDPSDPTNRNTPQTLEFAKYKMEVYQKVLKVIFASLKSCSWSGEPIRCPDNFVRVFHPGILISSLDGKEAAYFNACRAALANFPCPKCLVHKSDLHKITGQFKLRTTQTMKAVVIRARRKGTKTAKEDILKSHGLHDVQHFLWDYRFSDPYAAYSYDLLHSDDLGKWGHHIWPLLLDVLEGLKQKGPFAENMRRFPRWPNLKHFNQVTTVHFADGQKFKRVADDYGKDFDFFKQHALSHLVSDIRKKGTTNHGSTRPGEGFQQEARAAYARTNGKNAAHQMSRIDETQEAIARTRMAIDNHDKSQTEPEEVDETPVESLDGAHWTFRAPVPGRLVTSRTLEEDNSGSPAFRNFDLRLREFISETFPEEYIKYEDTIMIRSFKCIYISYQSMEDWRGARDILRCNPSFHQNVRYDCVLVNFTDPGLHFARLRHLLRCNLPSGQQIDIAIVRMFELSRWKPRTRWAGCQVRDEVQEYSLLSMEHVIRGAFLAPAYGAPNELTHFLVDTIDADMFLRADM
ncbi:hypothetical protein B0H14DRAFT_2406480 [Mycena olivaceomarginata]|nr:hypothetical protein B0H14DRAFT_2406480 [Mycena olivaceomarginata]